MAVTIPVIDSEAFTYRVALNNATYRVKMEWDESSSSWYFQLFDSSEVAITHLTKVLPAVPLVRTNVEVLDNYNFYARSLQAESRITRDNFGQGKTYQLYFATPEEVLDILNLALPSLNSSAILGW